MQLCIDLTTVQGNHTLTGQASTIVPPHVLCLPPAQSHSAPGGVEAAVCGRTGAWAAGAAPHARTSYPPPRYTRTHNGFIPAPSRPARRRTEQTAAPSRAQGAGCGGWRRPAGRRTQDAASGGGWWVPADCPPASPCTLPAHAPCARAPAPLTRPRAPPAPAPTPSVSHVPCGPVGARAGAQTGRRATRRLRRASGQGVECIAAMAAAAARGGLRRWHTLRVVLVVCVEDGVGRF
jgi:hypothetical protein